MSTTTTQLGFKDDQRQSTRVMHPPGGKTSDIFGVGPQYTSTTNKNSSKVETSKAETGNVLEPKNPGATAGPGARTVSNTSVRMRNRQGAFNPITGEAYSYATENVADVAQGMPEKTDEPVDDSNVVQNVSDGSSPLSRGKALPVHTSSRVLNPPGGPATSLW